MECFRAHAAFGPGHRYCLYAEVANGFRGRWFAGGGVAGGRVIGSSDRNGAYPATDLQTPENFAATIYHALGIPRDAHWHDVAGRPYAVHHADPIHELFA